MALAFKRAQAAAEAASYFKQDTEGVFTDAKLKKTYKIAVDWELIKAQQGEHKIYSNAEKPDPAPVVLCHMLGNDRLTFPVKDAIKRILADDAGKEAFEETFDAVIIRLKLADKHGATVTKEGKTLFFNIDCKLTDYGNCDRSFEASKLAKDIEAML